MRLIAVSGSNYTVAPQGTITPDGTYKFECFETGIVTKVSGNEVFFKPYSVDSLQQPPQSAAWNYGDQGLINDVTVRRNTFDVDPGFAHDVFLKKGYSPKGGFEIKNVNRFLFEGNRQIGYPANWLSHHETRMALPHGPLLRTWYSDTTGMLPKIRGMRLPGEWPCSHFKMICIQQLLPQTFRFTTTSPGTSQA
jgi:hypothetical protein